MFFQRLTALLGDCVIEASGDMARDPAGISNDHRRIGPGDLFVCISGYVNDGHAYAAGALENGAASIISEKPMDALGLPPELADRIKTFIRVADARLALAAASSVFYGEPSKRLALTGVTGTKGKTTTTYMIRSILRAAGIKTGLIGTVENFIGDEAFPSTETTPESVALAGYLSSMADGGCEHAVMEVSSQGLALRRVEYCDFDVGVFTNFYNDHISPNEHSDLDDYFRAKAKLFSLCKKAVVNADMPVYEAVLEAALSGGACGRALSYSADEKSENFSKAEVRASEIELINDKKKVYTRFHVETPWYSRNMTVNMPGRYNVSNALAAISVCGLYGIPEDCVARGLSEVSVRGRTELISEGQGFAVLVDYAHNAASLEALLKMLHEYEFNKITTVFGCGGNRARDRRFDMGEVSGRLSGFTVVTSDNPRKEEPRKIIADIECGLHRTDGRYMVIEDRAEAIEFAISNAADGDLVLIAGKGHEATQTFADRTIPFDDASVARGCLRKIPRQS